MKGSFRERAKQARNNLSKQHQTSYDRKDDKGFASEGVFDEKILKELGIEIWSPDKGDHLIDVVPFIAGTNHPEVNEGDIAYNVDYWAHQRIGDLNRFFVCQRTYKQIDVICGYIQKYRPEKKDWMAIKPTRRCAYLIWCHDNEKEEAKGIQVWDVSHFFFEAKVCAIQKDIKTGRPIVWSSFEKGRHIFFTISQSGSFEDSSGKKRDSIEFAGFQLVERNNPTLPDHILDQSFALDMAMKMHPTDDEVTEAFYGDKNKPTISVSSERQEQSQEPERAKSALERAKERIAQQKENDSQSEGKPASEPEPEPEPERMSDPEPERQTSTPEPKPEPERAVSSTSSSRMCPYTDIGGEFGVTIEQLAECDDCQFWKECKRHYHSLNVKTENETQQAPLPQNNDDEHKPRLVRRS